MHIDLRHQRARGLAVGQRHVLLDQPDDVAGQLRHLRRGQLHARTQAPFLGIGDAVVDQRAVLRLVARIAIEEAPAGQLRDLLADQLLLVEAIAQALLRQGRIDTQLRQHVVRRQPRAVARKARIRLDQVAAARVRVQVEQAVVGQRGIDPARAHHQRLAARGRRDGRDFRDGAHSPPAPDAADTLHPLRHGAHGPAGADGHAGHRRALRALRHAGDGQGTDLGPAAAGRGVVLVDRGREPDVADGGRRVVGRAAAAGVVTPLFLVTPVRRGRAGIGHGLLPRHFGVLQRAGIGRQRAAGNDLALVVEQRPRVDPHGAGRGDLAGVGAGDDGGRGGAVVLVLVPALVVAFGRVQVVRLVVVDVDAGIPRLVAVGRAVALVLDDVLRALRLHRRAEVRVGVVDLVGRQRQAAERLDRGTVVVDRAGRTRRQAIAVQRAADRHVAAAEDQRMLAVGDGLRADVEPVARGDGCRRTVLDIVVDGAGLDRDVVAIDAAGAEVVDRAGVDIGIAAVDQPPVGQRAGRGEVGRAGADFAAGGVVDVARGHGERVPGLQRRLVGQRAAGLHGGLAVGLQLAGVGEIAGQVQAQIALRQDAPVARQVGAVHAQRLAGDERAARVDHALRLGARVAVLHLHALARGDQALGVVERARTGQRQRLVGADRTALVVDLVGRQRDVLALQPLVGALGAGVVHRPGSHVERGARAHQAAAVVDGARADVGRQVAHRLEGAAPVVQAGAGQRDRLRAADLAALCIGDLRGGGLQVAVRANEAGAVVQVAGLQRHRALAENAARGAGMRVEQRLAVGIDRQRAGGLQHAGVVGERAALHIEQAARSHGAASVVECLCPAVKPHVLARHDAIGVSDTVAGDGQRLRGFDTTGGVIDPALAGRDQRAALHGADAAGRVGHRRRLDRHVPIGRQHPLGVVHRAARLHAQRIAGGQRAAGIRQRCRRNRCRAACADLALRAVVHLARRRDGQTGCACRLQRATLVDQAPRRDGQVAVARQRAAGVVEQRRGPNRRHAIAGLHQLTRAIGQHARIDLQAVGRGLPAIERGRLRAQRQRAVAGNRPPRAIDSGGGDGQCSGAGVLDAAVRVSQRRGAERQVRTVRRQAPPRVVDALGGLDGRGARAGLQQLARAVRQRGRVDRQVAGRGLSAVERDGLGVQRQRAVARDRAARAIDGRRLDGQRAGARMRDAAVRVGQRRRTECEIRAVGHDQAARVVERSAGLDRCAAGAGLADLAAPVRQRAGVDLERVARGLPRIEHSRLRRQLQRAVRTDDAAFAVQGAHRHRQRAGARMLDAPARVDQRLRAERQIGAVGRDATAGVVQLAGQLNRQVRCAGLDQLTLHIGQIVRSRRQPIGRDVRPIGAQRTGRVRRPCLRRRDRRATRIEIAAARCQGDVARGGAAVGEADGRSARGQVPAREILPLRIELPRCRELQRTARAHGAVTAQARAEHGAGLAVDGARRARRGDRRIALRRDHAGAGIADIAARG